jgi:hypothetical protein
MGFTLSKSSTTRLSDIVQSYRSGRIHLGELFSQIEYGVRQLTNHLLASKYFLQDFDAAQHYLPAGGRPIYSSTLACDHFFRATLLGIPINASIPLHDHPNMVSVLAFLSGMIHSPIYGVSRESGNHLVELKSCSDRTYSEGEIVILTPDTANLHSIEALTTKAVCLSLQLSIVSGLRKQACYLPAVPKDAENECSVWFRTPFRSNSYGT